MNKIAITKGILVTMSKKHDIIYGGTIVIDGDRISAVLPKGRWVPDGTEEIIDAEGMVIIPGLINAHLHCRPFRALGDGLGTLEWHRRYAQTFSSLMDEESTYLGAMNAYVENIKGGVTCVGNMPPKVAGSDRAALEIGIRAFLFPHGGSDPKLKEANESLSESLANVEKSSGQVGQRVKIWFGFGHPGECDKSYFNKIREYATKYKTGICGHVAVSSQEVALYPDKYETAEIVEYFHKAGFLGNDVVLVHGIHLTPNEIKLMADTKTSLIHCPSAVMKGGHRVTPIIDMLEAGVGIGLGTDGPLSSYRMDMFEIMRLTCFLQRVHRNNANAFPSLKALELATLGGARALRMENEIGSLEVGKKADVTLINFQQPHLAPLATGKHSNVIALLVFSCSASDVDTVIIDGRVVMRGRKLETVNEKRILAGVNEFATRILSKID